VRGGEKGANWHRHEGTKGWGRNTGVRGEKGRKWREGREKGGKWSAERKGR